MTIKQLLKERPILLIFYVLLGAGLGLNLYYFHKYNTEGLLQQPFRYQVGTKCGKIISNFADRREVKHGYTTDYFLKIEYPTGIETVKVTDHTWFDSEVGERICFAEYKSMVLSGLLALFTHLGLVITGAIILINLLFPNNKQD